MRIFLICTEMIVWKRICRSLKYSGSINVTICCYHIFCGNAKLNFSTGVTRKSWSLSSKGSLIHLNMSYLCLRSQWTLINIPHPNCWTQCWVHSEVFSKHYVLYHLHTQLLELFLCPPALWPWQNNWTGASVFLSAKCRGWAWGEQTSLPCAHIF